MGDEDRLAEQTIVHVIAALGQGGAEGVLMRLAAGGQCSKFKHIVVTLWDDAPNREDQLAADGVRVIVLRGRIKKYDPWIVLRLARVLRREKPAAVQTWMYHADLIGGLAAKLAGSPPVAWNIRNGTLAPAFSKSMTLFVAKLNARLSRLLATRIVCCAESAKRIHADLGYAQDRMIVIPNGFDVNHFRPDPEARRNVRAKHGIPQDARVIGLFGRFHPQKDHAAFFKAAGSVAKRYPDVHFLLCGKDVTPENAALAAMASEAGVGERCHLIGLQSEMAAIQASIDIACLCSQGGEGFPNVVGEAMACETPCIVTDVGDAALIVGETGRIVPIGDVDALAKGMAELLDLSNEDRGALGRRARQRICDRYDLPRMLMRYDEVYEELAGRQPVREWLSHTNS